MGSIKRRLERLEGRIHPPEKGAYNPQREAIISELRAHEEMHGTIREVAEREAEEGFPQRLHALLELEEHVQKRRDSR